MTVSSNPKATRSYGAAWEGDVTTGIKINLPVAKNKNGSEITGRVRAEYILGAPAKTVDVTAPPAYEAVSTSTAGATLTMCIHQNDAKVAIDNSQWAFADCSATPFPGTPSTTKVCLNGGFDTNYIYELIYTAKNPYVAKVTVAANQLVKQRVLLQQDADLIISQANAAAVP